MVVDIKNKEIYGDVPTPYSLIEKIFNFTLMILKNILQGWGNWALSQFKLAKPEIVQMSKMRLLICDMCEIRSGHICNPKKQGVNVKTKEIKNGCGCAIPPRI